MVDLKVEVMTFLLLLVERWVLCGVQLLFNSSLVSSKQAIRSIDGFGESFVFATHYLRTVHRVVERKALSIIRNAKLNHPNNERL